jgi:phosphoribosylformimino-5-aminoimidazole carboxamide ribotide isomerase
VLIYPAIDLKDGHCVRLMHGDFDRATLYQDDPFEQLAVFEEAGTTWLHVVDLDGAKVGKPVQHGLIGNLAAAATAHIQTGGGVRERDDVESLLDVGAARVVIGSAAVQRPADVRRWIEKFDPDRVCLALDVRTREDGGWEVTVRGWQEGSGLTLERALDLYPEGTARHVLITDVSRDGAMTGPNVELLSRIVEMRPDLRIQASGGVAAISDLHKLREIGAAGAIVGRALYEGKFTLDEALGAG